MDVICGLEGIALRAILTSVLLFTTKTLLAGSPQPPDGKPLKFEIISESKLPKGIAVYNPEDSELPLHEIRVAREDLNADRHDDYIIDVGVGGTGGSHQFVFLYQDGGYREVLQFQGGASLLPEKNGFSQIQVWSRAGGGVETRCVYSYQRNEYRLILQERYRRLDNDVMEHLPNNG